MAGPRQVQAQGGGGGSAGADAAAGQCIVRPGGSGGGWSMSLLEVSALGAVESIVVGVAGAGGVGNNGGGTGGASSLGGLVIAPGGEGGTALMSSGTTPLGVSGVTGPLRQFTIANSNYGNHAAQRRALHAPTHDHPTGRLLVSCGNRRASRRPACSCLRRRHLPPDQSRTVRRQRHPYTVETHPRVFATLTAPSFGAVHNRDKNSRRPA